MGCVGRDTLLAGVLRRECEGEDAAVDGGRGDEALWVSDLRDCGDMGESSRRYRCGERVGSFAMSLDDEARLRSAGVPAVEARRSLSR